VHEGRWRSVSSSLRDAFVAASLVWAALIVTAPYLASRAHSSMSASALILGVYGLGSLICHQLPERSYELWAAQMPVCARCAGIYFGAACWALAYTCIHAFDSLKRRGARDGRLLRTEASGVDHRSEQKARTGSLRHARMLLGIAAAPTALTLVYEWSTGDMPSHAIRAAAGVPIGLAVAWLVVAAADNQVN
jgi:uncharacterized membrane protein